MNNFLLDTHAFLWWALEPEKLPAILFQQLQNPQTRVVLSVVCSWEAQIKQGLGKLTLEESLQTIIEREIAVNHWEVLPVHLRHTWKLASLKPLHKDPFDRLLIAQALAEDLVLATKDPLITNYPDLKTFWN